MNNLIINDENENEKLVFESYEAAKKYYATIHNYKWNCRLTGIDTPEIRTRCKEEKEYGYKVRDYLREKILNKVVILKCGDFDKYGRLLTEIMCIGEECSVNQWLIQNDYAFSYDGGTKKSWKEHLEKN